MSADMVSAIFRRPKSSMQMMQAAISSIASVFALKPPVSMSTMTGRKPLKRSAIRVMLDSGVKGSENKGMRIKIPFIKCPGHVAKALLVFLAVATGNAVADSDDQQALFWSMHRDGEVAGYLLGTIHSEDPRVLEFSKDMLDKLAASQVFAMEMVPDLPTLAKLSEFMQLPPGQSVAGVIGRGRFDELVVALGAYQVPEEFIDRMKPWAAMMTLSTPPPVTGFYMDLSLSLRASGSGLKVVGLETLEQQLSFLEHMPMDMQLSLLDQAIDEFDKVGQAHDEMVKVYLHNDLARLQALSDEQMLDVGAAERDYFMQTGIVERNRRMAESLLPHVENGGVFAAVGALHLAGEEGLVSLLRKQGLELKPLAMPLSRKPN